METNISLFHALEVQTMAFRGNVKPERWNQLLNPMDDMTRIVVSHFLGEGMFNYDFSWRTNSDIIGSFIGCLSRANIEKWDMIKLCYNVFNPIWCVGLEEAVMSIHGKCRNPLPKMYITHPPGSFELAIVPRHPSLVIQENSVFFQACLKIVSSIHFL